MRKTVAIVLNTSWNIFNFRTGLLKTLRDEGYRIVCIAPKDDYSLRLEAMGFEYQEIKMNNKGTNPLEDIKLVYHLYKCYKEVSPDVLLHYTIKPNIYGAFAARMLGIPVISNISGLGTVFLNDNITSKIARFLYKIALKTPQKVFFQNRDDRKLFVDAALVQESKTDILPGSGIDTQRFAPRAMHAKEGKVRFLLIARLVKDKGIVEYVEAAREAKDEKREFCILGAYYFGNPTAISAAQMQAWEEEGVVRYLGESDDVASQIAQADCIVLPSYREGLSRVLLEAASMAKPLITSDVPGCKDVVDDGINGYLCEVKSKESLAKQMTKMALLSRQAREAMGQKGRLKVIAEFDEKVVIEKYVEAIREFTT